MDRRIVYPGAIPLDTDVLLVEQRTMAALGYLAQATIGSVMLCDDLAITPATPASMTVTVGPGSVIDLTTLEGLGAFGSLPQDTTTPLMKMGINLIGTAFTLTAPTVAGQSINYLIEATFVEADTTPVVLPYYNAANPAVPYSGPGNTGTSQNTTRAQTVGLQMKAGVAANTGTQTTPAVDSGWLGIYVITVNYGQTSITSTNLLGTQIVASFIQSKLSQNFAALAGSSGQVFSAANATSAAEVVPLGQADARYAPAAYFTNETVLTASGNWTVPAGITRVYVEVIGGGGGGGGTGTSGTGGGSGGGGGGAAGWVNGLTPGALVAVTVGAAGVGSSSGGTAGGTSSFGSFMSATGGSGGNPYSGTPAGGGGGSGSGGTLAQSGQDGGDGYPGACGGSPAIIGGSGGRAGNNNGIAALGYGGGGGGAYLLTAGVGYGSNGGPGIVIVRW